MKRKDNMLITTTATLEGWTIETYIGTITSHIVAGTGLFSDLFASLTDVFGGRSNSYQKQLAAINDEVIASLKQQAISMGANCIIGLRIDHNQISGKDKQMFMVTATGTAVIVTRMEDQALPDRRTDQEFITEEELLSILNKRQAIRASLEGKLIFNYQTWNYIIEKRVEELIPAVISELEKHAEKEYPDSDDQLFIKRCKELFYSLPTEMIKDHLYALFRGNANLYRFALEIIGELSLLDLENLYELIGSENFDLRKRALQLLRFHKPYYYEADVQVLDELIKLIDKAFEPRAERITEKAMLSSKVKELWKCDCGSKVEVSNTYCHQCFRDKWGFGTNEINPTKAKSLVSERIAVLKEQFSNQKHT
jgi:uncharacterized protein YbjQ (UPF0145 family)